MMNVLRLVYSSRSAWRRTCQSGFQTVTCPVSSFSNGPLKDTCHNKEKRGVAFSRRLVSVRDLCTGRVDMNCWNCHHPRDRTPAFFCLSCKVVQPPDEHLNYFKIMDCERNFTLNTQKLQKTYLQLQRLLHPDNFSQKSLKEQEFSEHQSALVNKAYNTLLKPLSRGLYMLELEGMHIEEGTDSAADSVFLMELMEINEALDEAQTPDVASQIGKEMKGKLAGLTEKIDAALRKGELQAAKQLLVQMKYFANIEEKVKEKLAEFM
ncbi:iron-sulfur cluster co-chaperone protein HscB [Synchiropus splendidus]|uniref:iron-sulfur cluster co-chaperone protein HscB n=1 Tax=Synchiropus splendidus TaxID=270530 RepID=UPI00237E50FD|nr:iron-sulfur cluster co-chaperone protein HscB [Synchiropus splendidus]